MIAQINNLNMLLYRIASTYKEKKPRAGGRASGIRVTEIPSQHNVNMMEDPAATEIPPVPGKQFP